jgi:cell division protein FtsL
LVVAKKDYEDSYYTGNSNNAYDFDFDYDNRNYKDYYDTKNEEYIENKKRVNKSLKENHKKKVKGQLKLLLSIFIISSISLLILARYVMIMDLNNDINKLKKEVINSEKMNENLKVELMKHCDIKQIEEVASSKLGMVHPSGINTVYLDGKVDDKANKDESVKEEKKVSFIDKIVKYLY